MAFLVTYGMPQLANAHASRKPPYLNLFFLSELVSLPPKREVRTTTDNVWMFFVGCSSIT